MIGNVQNNSSISKVFKTFKLISSSTQQITLVKPTDGFLGSIVAIGLKNDVGIKYLHFYDSVITDKIILSEMEPAFIFPIPMSDSGAGFSISFPEGVYFENGIVTAITNKPYNLYEAILKDEVIVNLTIN